MKNFESLKKFLSTPRKIVITTHMRPDADALGSSLAVFQFLIKNEHIVNVITPTDYPEFLKWMPYEDNVTIYTEEKKESDSVASNMWKNKQKKPENCHPKRCQSFKLHLTHHED